MTRSLAHNAGLRAKPTAWMAQAACRGVDAETMFPEVGGNHAADAARALCRSCAVRIECLNYAMAHPAERWGVWGGLVESERQRLRVGLDRQADGREIA